MLAIHWSHSHPHPFRVSFFFRTSCATQHRAWYRFWWVFSYSVLFRWFVRSFVYSRLNCFLPMAYLSRYDDLGICFFFAANNLKCFFFFSIFLIFFVDDKFICAKFFSFCFASMKSNRSSDIASDLMNARSQPHSHLTRSKIYKNRTDSKNIGRRLRTE